MNYLRLIFMVLCLLFAFPKETLALDSEISCLAMNIYHEARNQSTLGQIAVGFVTINRMKSEQFPDTICEVITEAKTWNGKPIKNKCQFSWFCNGVSDSPKNTTAYLTALGIATALLDPENSIDDPTNGSLWYHAHYVNPSWSNSFEKVTIIEDHIFYRK